LGLNWRKRAANSALLCGSVFFFLVSIFNSGLGLLLLLRFSSFFHGLLLSENCSCVAARFPLNPLRFRRRFDSVMAVMRFENHVLLAGIENGLDVWFTTNNGSNSRWIIVDLWKETRKIDDCG
jgi:hypothetical protein